MAWTVAVLLTFAVVTIGPLVAAKEVEDQLSYGNGDGLTISKSEMISEEEPVQRYPAERALPSCEDFGGKCISKKGADIKCKGRVGAQFACSSNKKVCCIDGCPDDTFWFSPSNQCFRLSNTRMNWFEALQECKDAGLVLARPYFPVALREYLVMRYGYDVEPWLNARGNGTYIIWQNDGDRITKDNPLWWPGMPGSRVTTNNCLVLRARESFWKENPDKPLYPSFCSSLRIRALCEWELKQPMNKKHLP